MRVYSDGQLSESLVEEDLHFREDDGGRGSSAASDSPTMNTALTASFLMRVYSGDYLSRSLVEEDLHFREDDGGSEM